jgi:hypothetical protein
VAADIWQLVQLIASLMFSLSATPANQALRSGLKSCHETFAAAGVRRYAWEAAMIVPNPRCVTYQ